MITVEAMTGAGELALIRLEDGILYHVRHHSSGDEMKPIASSRERSMLYGAWRHDWDMRAVEFNNMAAFRQYRRKKAQEMLDRMTRE